MKKNTVNKEGITFVEVPCWWDGALESLSSSIHFQRPDLSLPGTYPVPLNPPASYFHYSQVAEVGELMLASFPTENFAESISPHNPWWMGEKYDGIRCYWSDADGTVYSRNGRYLTLAPNMYSHLHPLLSTDSELWFGRGQFSNTYHLVIGSSSFVPWHSFRMVTFDVPSVEYEDTPFEERYELLLANTFTENPFNVIASRVLCTDQALLEKYTQNILGEEGEGVIMRKFGSGYERGRTRSLIKLKATQSDREGIVIGRDRDGVKLKLPDGIVFSVPSQNVHIPTPQIGDVVTFSYESSARRGIPVDPTIYRIRNDLSWDDVVRSSHNEKAYLNEQSYTQRFTSQPLRYWTAKTTRLFLEKFAKNRNMDPLCADTWYNTSAESIRQEKGGITVLQQLKGGFYQLIQFIFPEIEFDNTKFQSANKWLDIESRRRFFEAYANENKFDPLIAENWYMQSYSQFFSENGARGVLIHHKNSVRTALMELFPNIGIDKSKFHFQLRAIKNRREFFESFAVEHGFDPLSPTHWYKQSIDQIMASKKANKIIGYYNDSAAKALIRLFPEVNFDKSKFHFHSYWSNTKNRKAFFMKYAKGHHYDHQAFDPLVPDNWYSQPTEKILSLQGARSVMFYYEGSIANALLSLFPNIGLDPSKFRVRGVWKDVKQRRKFFIDYAKANGFDPLKANDWYSQPKERIMAVKGAQGILYYHPGGIQEALINLFPDIPFEKSNFHHSYEWRDAEKRKRFFEEYAKRENFDPSDPSMWYTQPRHKIVAEPGAHGVLFHHDSSVPEALLSLFPNIGLVRSKLYPTYTKQDKIQFFENYAKENHFDPLQPEHWYLQPTAKIMAFKNAKKIMPFYQGRISKALLDLFPNIGFDKTRFKMKRRHQKGG